VLGAAFRLSRERGRWLPVGEGQLALATWHPSAVLRARSPDRARLYAELVADLRLLAVAIG
jgi:DNA polymerase